MKRLLLMLSVILSLALGLIVGFNAGRRKAEVCTTPVARMTVVEQVPLPAAAEPKVKIKQEMISRKKIYDSLISDFQAATNSLNNQLLSLSKASEYLRQQTEDAEKAGSIEGSLVSEARFRESLEAIIGLQRQFLLIREKFIADSRGYAEYLENLILQNAPD